MLCFRCLRLEEEQLRQLSQNFLFSRHVATSRKAIPDRSVLPAEVTRSYRILQVSADHSTVEVKDAFIRLAKQYHPDSSVSPDGEKFKQVETAYRTVMDHRKVTNVDKEVKDVVEKDLGFRYKSVAHRTYLSNEGVGYGTPSMRQRQYQQFKAVRAAENVFNYRMEKTVQYTEDALVTLDRQATKKQKTQNAIERIVEDLIQSSMANGEFDNLPGAGKPLDNFDHNPHVDSMTHRLNKIMINNGFTPEWAVLGKDIEVLKDKLKEKLAIERASYGDSPTKEDKERWEESIKKFAYFIEDINAKIKKFNFCCPTIQQQLVPTRLDLFSDRIFYGGTWREKLPVLLKTKEAERTQRIKNKWPERPEKSAADDQGGFLSLFSFLLK
ncbi:hypothetical protein RvY_17200 [Ramazzottius varieornatus]|uniref:J domain-containing protein n=1 Tax=Ramazzottius varieornatus TaxID=947166 RepID=A0A1D1W1R8_RAMVA|nr:hypothetical protein RvY_17200 [Ramazzottius varieornatus]